jgi:hypothetical protein
MKKIIKIFPHLTFILAACYLTLVIFDNFNPAMDLLNNPISEYAIWVLCILTIISSLITIIRNNKE